MNKVPFNTSWHASEITDVLEQIESEPEGLTIEEAEKRLSRYGKNKLRPPKKQSPVIRFLLQFHNVLIYVLLAAGIITALLSHWVDAGVIFGVIIVNALIGFIQEGKAEKALDAIRSILSQQAFVLRDGKKVMIPADGVVPGDIVFLQSGDKVPADIRLIKTKELRIDEAALTGESMPVDKTVVPVIETAVIGDRKCMAFSATFVTYGQGTGVVVSTGDDTEIGRINMMLSNVKPLTTRLLRQIAEFGYLLTMAIGAMAIFTFVFGIMVRQYKFGEMFLAAVGMAVAAIPEGLPAIITITLAIGVKGMATRNAIIRRLPAVETLGSVTVICSDKTGTLTRNEMTVQTIATVSHLFDVSGVGYEPHGEFSLDGKNITLTEHPTLRELAQAALLCNDAELHAVENQWQMHGDPTEGALVSMGIKAGMEHANLKEMYPRTDVIPFESEHRFMATLHHDHSGHGFIYVKGAPEKVLMMCDKQRSSGVNEPINIKYWNNHIEEIAGRGQRVLAIASMPTDVNHRTLQFSDVNGGLSILGFIGIIDPPRTEAIKAVQLCKSAGIRVKMITGDHISTARSIGAKIGIGDGKTAISGTELDVMDDNQFRLAVQKADIFARVSPEHKLKLVQSLQANGEVVAMTGDGVNDAPALKRADVGIAMGIKGTDVAKESAEMVLTDDNFASITNAVEQGRTVYSNIKKSITFILPTNGGEAGIIIAAVLTGRLLPITPVQILWVNMITAVTLALSLAFEPPEAKIMQQSPRNPKEPILSPFLIWRILFVSAIMVMGTFGLFLWDRLHNVSIEYARTVSVNTLVMFEIFYLLNTRFLRTSVFTRKGFTGNRYIYIAIGAVIIAQLFFTYTPFMQHLFGVKGLKPVEWIYITIITFSVFVLVEIEKLILQKRERRKKKIPEQLLK
ncbi:ATPase P [Candidatus Scalindua japonica]|uniref:ATPase P n=1 Tax=Candidatus Scalindua japonica TaxID=1284222 RepID=A0A286U4K6_9BACT|nr:cation-transporting P-type ATPase [Candidatus Scalindua japonica]GAX63034.1 ATPase P [Candidatus Scalindua japonica]